MADFGRARCCCLAVVLFDGGINEDEDGDVDDDDAGGAEVGALVFPVDEDEDDGFCTTTGDDTISAPTFRP